MTYMPLGIAACSSDASDQLPSMTVRCLRPEPQATARAPRRIRRVAGKARSAGKLPRGAARATRRNSRDVDVLLDQYYTSQAEANRLYAFFRRRFDPRQFLMVEPSAGTGAFFILMPAGSLAYDIDPKCHGVVAADFLSVVIESDRPIAIVGNPPFGRRSETAIRFFNHAARTATVIAMVLPRTFRKTRTQNRLDPAFHLVHEEPVRDNAFVFRGRPYDVPATFQIWVRRPEPRSRPRIETSHPDFEFLDSADGADFGLQRVGARAGQIHHNFGLKPSSHHFIRGKVREIMGFLDFDSVSGNVAGNPSLSRSEVVTLYREWFRKLANKRPTSATLSDYRAPTKTNLKVACSR